MPHSLLPFPSLRVPFLRAAFLRVPPLPRGVICGLTWSAFFLLGSLSPLHADNENLLLGNPSRALPAIPQAASTDPDKIVPATGVALGDAPLGVPIVPADPLLPGVAVIPLPATDANNLLVEHPEFALSYNQKDGGPNWVSWHLAQGDRGRSGRSEDFRSDPLLPEAAQIRPTDYRGSGYDRGHQCPSGDRTANKDANANTFLMSNMLPQTADLNRQLWRKFEEYCRDQLRGGANEEYILCGGLGSIERIADGQVNVPAFCWKVAVILPSGDDDLKRIDARTRVIAVMMPNKSGTDIATGAWKDFLTSVDKIEEATHLDLLSSLPLETQKILEARIDTGRAPSTPTGAGTTGAGTTGAGTTGAGAGATEAGTGTAAEAGGADD